MASVVSPYRPILSPTSSKKRPLSKIGSTDHSPVKRLQPLRLPSKYSGAIAKSPAVPQKAMAQPTGLDGYLNLDQHFVEATKATVDDEARHTVQLSAESSYKALLFERRQMASRIPGSWASNLSGGSGFKNFTGALCYRHSLFQALLHMPKFVYWLDKYHKSRDCVSDRDMECISCQMRKLCKIYWHINCKDSSLVGQLKKIHALFKHLGWKTNSLNGHGDPDDQLAWMLSVMRSEMPSSIFGYFDAFHNLLLESEIKCDRCGHVSKTQGNNERHLSIPINVPTVKAPILQLYIKAYMDEVIQGYRCENNNCKHVSDKHRIQKIAYAPDVLLIQLKRFNFRGMKDSSPVRYGGRLDLSSHSANPSLGPLTYDLTAVISHAGSTSFGHYHCLAKDASGEWAEFDDDQVYASQVKEALNPGLIDREWTPYLLFYQRNTASMPPP